MRKYVRSIRVEDPSGAQFELYEFAVRGWIRGTRIFELDSGEAVRRLDRDSFILVSTGERLVRVT